MKNHAVEVIILSIFLVSCYGQFKDEMQTFEEECMGENKFICLEGGCIDQEEYCNGIPNCVDGSDENFCVDHLPDAKLCNETHSYMCLDGKKCISHLWICNNETDCDDGSDEVNCTAPVIATNATCHGFQCGNGTCISPLWVCDGVYDCSDKSDENNPEICRQTLIPHAIVDGSLCQEQPALSERNYKCLDSSYCLPSHMMCNGMKDCRDGSDEGPFCNNCKCFYFLYTYKPRDPSESCKEEKRNCKIEKILQYI